MFAAPLDIPADIAANQQALLRDRHTEQRAKMASLDADMLKRKADIEAIQNMVTELKNSVSLITQQHQMRKELAKTEHNAQTTVIDAKLELISTEKELAVQNSRFNESSANHQAAVAQHSQALAEFKAMTWPAFAK